jgi:hypothetical protein
MPPICPRFGMSFAPYFLIELAARVPHRAFAMAGPRAAAWAGEIRADHGGIKSRETSVALVGAAQVGANFQDFEAVWSW